MRNILMHLRRMRNAQKVKLHGVTVSTALGPKSLRSALFKGTYERNECTLVKRVVHRGDRVLEVGAGIGLVSLLCTRLAGEGNVLSCEANAALEPVIRENYRLNGWTPLLRIGAVTADGREISFFRDDNVLSSSLLQRSSFRESIPMASTRIEYLIDEHRPSVLIMDVEGSEVELLGASDMRSIRHVVVEMHPHIVGAGAIDALLERMREVGLSVRGQLHKTLLLSR